MASKASFLQNYLDRLFSKQDIETLPEQMRQTTDDLPERFPASSKISNAILKKRWSRLPDVRAQLLDPFSESQISKYEANIENFIGTVKVPVGIVGPLRVNGLFAKGDYLIPLATTEAALIASYHRGSCLLTASGGCLSAILSESVNRSPAFEFKTLVEAGTFMIWIIKQINHFKKIVSDMSNYANLVDLAATIEGNHVYLNFEFTTGDASGQNMVTICTAEICKFIIDSSPVKPTAHYIESNLSGDKKASTQAFTTVRGKKVCAEAKIPAKLIKKILGTSPDKMVKYWKMSAIGGVLSGTIGIQGHFANGLAAFYIACGQDAACVAESAIGVTRFELSEDGSLYAAVTLPGIMVGTVGGGTSLPSQQACLEIMGLAGKGQSPALAEVCCGMLLAGELSIIGALAAGDFTKAHKRLARDRRQG